ncbi:MAG: hypothetical protein H0Z53_02650 [Nitrosospira sp.]|nr:hypothetical protein [Nitrosospira sp.]
MRVTHPDPKDRSSGAKTPLFGIIAIKPYQWDDGFEQDGEEDGRTSSSERYRVLDSVTDFG